MRLNPNFAEGWRVERAPCGSARPMAISLAEPDGALRRGVLPRWLVFDDVRRAGSPRCRCRREGYLR